MSLPNSVILRQEKNFQIENAQSNTMLCKGNMNFGEPAKKMRSAPERVPQSNEAVVESTWI